MKRPVLFHRREVWIPTFSGWLTILALGSIAVVGMARQVCPFLSPTRPLGARLLVVEGWMPEEELDQAVDVFRSGPYERLVTTGGPIPRGIRPPGVASYAELSRNYLTHRGLAESAVVAVPAPESAQERTFLSAVMVREWSQRQVPAVDAFDLFSSGVHSRRSWAIYEKAFGPGVRVGILASRPSTYDPEAWWRTSVGAKTILSESIGWIWTELFFHPGLPGTHAEKWGGPGPQRQP